MNRGGLRHLPDALARGAVAFVAVAAVGQALAFGARVVADTGPSIETTFRIGAIYVGAFNHVAIELEVVGSDSTAAGVRSTSLSIGIAFLSVTALGMWLLFRGGRSVAERLGGNAVARVAYGTAVAPAFALPVFALALFVDVRTSLRVGAFSPGEVRVSLSTWQALVFPFAIAVAAGGAGGLASALRSMTATNRIRAARAAIAGGWRMFVVGLVLSLGGLFVAGVVQADEPVALFTPSTARYWRAVLDRPGVGLAGVVHHLAAIPNEAMWTLVPAMGACDVVRGSADGDLVCYGRFPNALRASADPGPDDELRLPIGDVSFARPPPGYMLFLLVPAIASILGGRRAAAVSERAGSLATAIGAASGVVFGAFVAAGGLLASLVIAYAGASGRQDGGWIMLGPDVVGGTALAVVWGCLGGAVGAATFARSRTRSPRTVDRTATVRP